MPRVILVSGSINAGKTTVSRLLVKRIPRTAHVAVDSLRDFVRWMPLSESIALNLANAAAVACNFLDAGLHVVLDSPLSQADHDGFVAALGGRAERLDAFVLAPPIEVALRDRGARPLDAWERARIHEMYEERIHEPGFGIAIDTSELTPDQTVDEILGHLGLPLR